uniref:Brinker DNA-binding domain-containing protein n=1 Tax=Ditylenchus dipsaci TaxID=166011 RepID=A0A915D4H2_9BILA
MSRAKKKARSASCSKAQAYSLEKKLEAIDYTKKYSKNLAAKKFGVDRARVIEWVKQEVGCDNKSRKDQSESLELKTSTVYIGLSAVLKILLKFSL